MTLSLVFKALADETRREILRLLRGGDRTAGEIAGRFDLTKPTISHHLGVLKQANLVQDYRRGQHVYYSLNTTVFQETAAWFLAVMEGRGGKEAGKAVEKRKAGGDEWEGGKPCGKRKKARVILSPGRP